MDFDDLKYLEPGAILDFSYMFGDDDSKHFDVEDWDTSNGKFFDGVFYNCSNVQALDLSGWDMRKATSVAEMFFGCSNLQELEINGWDIYNCADFSYMFFGCKSLKSLDLSNWRIYNGIIPKNLLSMFEGAKNLTELYLPKISDFSNSFVDNMFTGCTNLRYIKGGFKNLRQSISFKDCPLTRETALEIINNLFDFKNKKIGNNQSVIQFNYNTLSDLTQEDLKLLNDKEWSLGKVD